eukprot:508838_1
MDIHDKNNRWRKNSIPNKLQYDIHRFIKAQIHHKTPPTPFTIHWTNTDYTKTLHKTCMSDGFQIYGASIAYKSIVRYLGGQCFSNAERGTISPYLTNTVFLKKK